MNRRDASDPSTVELQCSDCNGRIRTENVRHVFTYGVGPEARDLECTLPVRICDACGAEYVDEEGEEIRHEAVCRHLNVLTPREIQTLRAQYGTQASFAALTGIGEASLSRWETGASIQSKAYDNYLRLLQRPENIRSLLSRQRIPGVDERAAPKDRFRCIEVNRTRLVCQATFVLRPAA
jgi:putative zinc finger/helix-turn-helix YgiT family protein